MAKGWFKWLVLGGILASLGKGFEAMGDAAPWVEGGVSTERALFHGLALILVLGTLACMVRALWIITAGFRGGGTGGWGGGSIDAPRGTEAFDPDAALAHYLENRPEPEPERPSPAAPRPGFGRRIV